MVYSIKLGDIFITVVNQVRLSESGLISVLLIVLEKIFFQAIKFVYFYGVDVKRIS